ncbi:hypothetical protein DV735_g204, partial [Chaetothyriales sp. CBS 134920]
MAATARPSSAIARIEGAFNRCVMRIAQAVQDPSTYGDSTKPFIQECALQFHDALDDCEVQILDAKWYLEHQLAQNKARREARAREEGLAAQKRKLDQVQEEGLAAQKRKLDQAQEKGEPDRREGEAKRARLDAPPREKMAPKTTEQDDDEELTIVAQPFKADRESAIHTPSHGPEAAAEQSPKRAAVEPLKQTSKPTPIPQKQASPQTPPQVATTAADRSAVPTSDGQPTPQVTPALTNDEFSFVSMFQEPAQDAANLDDPNNPDLNLDADLGDEFARAANGAGGGNNTGDSSQGDALSGLLPALDNFDQDMNFDLPPLHGPNEFDALFNEDGFDMDPDGAFSNEALNMENLDLDSMFS